MHARVEPQKFRAALHALPDDTGDHGKTSTEAQFGCEIFTLTVERLAPMDNTAELAREFARESNRIDQLIWDAIALRAGETALFCACSNNIAWIKRAVEIGVDVSVIANDPATLGELQSIPVTVVRGSSSMMPGRDGSYDAAIAFHYLHEIDPFFHANVVTELGRVGKRLVIVEPEPPRDPLGSRISALYSRVKRELGQFENYHPLDYWRKLLAIVKSDVRCSTYTFMRTPPRFAMRETVSLIIDMMAAEDTPESYLTELRALAKRPDAVLVPQSRFVIVGSAVGQPINVSAGAPFRERAPGALPRSIPSPFVAPPAAIPGQPAAAAPKVPTVYSPAQNEPEFPVVTPPQRPEQRIPAAVGRAAAAAGNIARNAFGLPPREEAPRRNAVVPSVKGDDEVAFGLPAEAADAAAEYGWEWETPTTP